MYIIYLLFILKKIEILLLFFLNLKHHIKTTTFKMDNNVKKVFRFKFADDIANMITEFSKTHQFDDRHKYKESWQGWITTNHDMVQREVNRLKDLGYTGDVEDKMFKAGRYYFREKKTVGGDDNTTTTTKTTTTNVLAAEGEATAAIETAAAVAPPAPVAAIKTRKYIVMSQEVIVAMDTHLKSAILVAGFKPATGYADFCEKNLSIINVEIGRIRKLYTIVPKELADKIKKTYKNRYFNLVKQL